MTQPELDAVQHDGGESDALGGGGHAASQHLGASPAPPRSDGAGALVDRAFSRRTAIWLSVAAGISLVATLVLPLFAADVPERETRGPNAYSRSAVGHHAFVTVLRELGLPVLVSRYKSADRAAPGQPLVIAEPADHDEAELEAMIALALGNGADVVVVLPKWDPDDWDPPKEDDENEAAAEEAPASGDTPLLPGVTTPTTPKERPPTLLATSEVTRVLWAAERGVARHWGVPAPDEAYAAEVVVRGSASDGWDGPLARFGTPSLPNFQGLALFGGLDVVLGSGDRLLIGGWRNDEAGVARLYVVTDPELFDTMGLGLGDNAVLAYRFFAETLGAQGLVFDEVVHGFKKAPSIWSDLFEFPLILLTLHLLGLLALGLWAAGSRFGKPDALPPRVAPGKGALIANTATLLAVGGHSGYALREYLRGTVRLVARDYALPTRLDDEERLATLARLAADRGVKEDLTDLARRVVQVGDTQRDARRALALARRIYRFRLEMTDGHRQHRWD